MPGSPEQEQIRMWLSNKYSERVWYLCKTNCCTVIKNTHKFVQRTVPFDPIVPSKPGRPGGPGFPGKPGSPFGPVKPLGPGCPGKPGGPGSPNPGSPYQTYKIVHFNQSGVEESEEHLLAISTIKTTTSHLLFWVIIYIFFCLD